MSRILSQLFVCAALLATVQPGVAQNLEAGSPEPPCEEDSPGPAPADSAVDRYLKSIPERVKDFVNKCEESTKPECGDQIVSVLFTGLKHSKISDKCCDQLVSMGILCHKTIIKIFIGRPDVEKDAPVIKANSHKVFKYCAKVTRRERLNNYGSPPKSF